MISNLNISVVVDGLQ